jgi:hypothetical protein
MNNSLKSIIAIAIALFSFANTQAQGASALRTSMTATVGKQSQGISVAIVDGGCVISAAGQKAYQVNTANKSMVEISQAQFGDRVNAGKQSQGVNFGDRVNAGLQQAGGVVSGAAGMLGGAMPGGSIVSATVSSVSSMVNGGASSAAYAATGRMAPVTIRDNEKTVALPNLADGDYELTFVIVENGQKTQVKFGFSIENGVLKTKHDTVKNSISNVR